MDTENHRVHSHAMAIACQGGRAPKTTEKHRNKHKKSSSMRSTLRTTLGAAFSKSEVIYRQIAVSERLPRNNASKRDEPATNLLLIDFDQSD